MDGAGTAGPEGAGLLVPGRCCDDGCPGRPQDTAHACSHCWLEVWGPAVKGVPLIRHVCEAPGNCSIHPQNALACIVEGRMFEGRACCAHPVT